LEGIDVAKSASLGAAKNLLLRELWAEAKRRVVAICGRSANGAFDPSETLATGGSWVVQLTACAGNAVERPM
jgi:hypothetical protein